MHTVMQFSIIKNKTFIQTQPSFYFFSFFFFNSLVPFIFNYLLLASLGSNPESHALTHTTDNDPFLLANVTYSVLPWKKNNNNNDNKPNKNKHKEKKTQPSSSTVSGFREQLPFILCIVLVYFVALSLTLCASKIIFFAFWLLW